MSTISIVPIDKCNNVDYFYDAVLTTLSSIFNHLISVQIPCKWNFRLNVTLKKLDSAAEDADEYRYITSDLCSQCFAFLNIDPDDIAPNFDTMRRDLLT